MTTSTLDPAIVVKQFRDGLPPRAQNQLRNTGRIAALVHRAVFTHGWTLEQLHTECTRDWNDAANLGGLITFRLEWCADNPPPAPPGPRRTHWNCCDNGWIYDETADPPIARKCPGMNP